jgi:hypothetical protein
MKWAALEEPGGVDPVAEKQQHWGFHHLNHPYSCLQESYLRDLHHFARVHPTYLEGCFETFIIDKYIKEIV